MFAFIVGLLVILPVASFAYRPEGTATYKDYLIILIHGINGESRHFNGQDYRDPDMKLQQYLENDLGLAGHVYAYSFYDKNGSSLVSVHELADRNYNNKAHYVDENGNDRPMDGQCWLEKAQSDYKDWFKAKYGRDAATSEVPSKYIFITHSMGNMPARLYIYSKYMLGKDYYQNDVDKVVFIAPPFCGSDGAYYFVIPKTILTLKQEYDSAMAIWGMWNKIWSSPGLYFADPHNTYDFTKTLSMVTLDYPGWLDNNYALLGIQAGANQREWNSQALLEGTGYGIFNPGLWELMPEYMLNTAFPGIQDAHLSDETKEPDYSVLYFRGAPVVNAMDSNVANVIMQAVKYASGDVAKSYMTASLEALNSVVSLVGNSTGTDVSLGLSAAWDKLDTAFTSLNNIISDPTRVFGGFNDELYTLLGSRGFADLSTSQCKFYSIIHSNPYFTFNIDGDGAVPVESAKGIYNGKSTRALRNALFYDKTYSCAFNDYLDNEFPREVADAVAIYYAVYFSPELGGGPTVAENMKPWLELALAAEFIERVGYYAADLRDQEIPHTNANLKQYDMISTALLDSYGIMTIQDMQCTQEAESVSASDEVRHYFTSITPEAGWFSIPVRSFATRDNTDMSVVGPVPATIDGTREYVSQLLVTQKPLRVVAKLNYLIPQKLKQFQYSFNFQAWQDVPNVDNYTGVVTFEGLHFAEGQNLLAVRTTNYAGIHYNQLIKVILNTIIEPELACLITSAAA